MNDGKLRVKRHKEFNILAKPIRKTKIEKDPPNAFDRLEMLEKRIEVLEKLYREVNNLAIANRGEIEKIKDVVAQIKRTL